MENSKSTNCRFEFTDSIIYGDNQKVQQEFPDGLTEFHKKPSIFLFNQDLEGEIGSYMIKFTVSDS